jgi:hypothetical protein
MILCHVDFEVTVVQTGDIEAAVAREQLASLAAR